MPYRVDYGTLGEATRTPQGGLAVPAALTRAGVFTYVNPDGTTRREWRPLSEVQRADTLASLKGAPLTVRHPPPGRLAPENYNQYARGHVGDDVRMDSDKTAATLYVQGKEALDAIKSGWREVSCGYDARRIDATPGVVPEGEPDAGQRYDMVQRDIQYNHVALVPKGRAGTDVRLRLDSAGDSIREDEDMKIEIIGGTEYEVGTPAHADARKRQDAADAATKAEVERLRTEHAEAKGQLAATKSRLDALEAAEKQRADAAEREVLIGKAASVLGAGWKADGKDSAAITAEILAKQFPDVRLDEVAEAERPAYVKGLLATIKSGQRTDAAPRRAPAAPVPFAPTTPGKPTGTAAYRADNYEEMESLCQRPMAISRYKPQPMLQQPMIENQR